MAKEIENTNLIPEKLQFIAELSRTSAWIANRYTNFLKPYEISTQQFNILRVLRSADDWVAMNKVNELLIIKSPNITRLADKLVTKKLVNRDRGVKDRRVVYIQITEEGQNLLTQIDEKHEGTLSEYMNSFTKEEAVMMTEVLKKIRG
jgi:DNA-binding MarR family transcriptional regulator